MTDHQLAFLVVVIAFVSLSVAVAGYFLLRARRASQGTWEGILSRLTALDRDHIAEIALDIIDTSGHPRTDESSATLESSQIWELVGGWRGLEALESNCAVLIDLAFYVQQWYPEAVAVTEELRLNAREIEWHISRLKIARQRGKLESTIPMYAQRAIATYYIMTRRVLALYEQVNLPMLQEVQRAL